jgi:HlyD family secretion protein
VLVQPSDRIVKGQLIAKLAQPKLAQQIAENKALLADLERQQLQLQGFGSKETALGTELLKKQQQNIEGAIALLQKNMGLLQSQEKKELALLEKGLITRPQVQATTQKIEQAKQEIASLRAQEVLLSKQQHNTSFSVSSQMEANQLKMNAVKRQIDQLTEQYDYQTLIKSDFEGEVLERLIDVGDVVSVGTSLIKITKDEGKDGMLSGVLFLQAKDGKKISMGQEIMIAPSTVLPQEYGYMQGEVTYISEYPTSAKAMFRVLRNEQLITQIMQMGPPIEVYVRFKANAETFSKYTWTSGTGPAMEIKAGTPCTGKIVIDEQRPIALVIPKLKKLLSLY